MKQQMLEAFVSTTFSQEISRIKLTSSLRRGGRRAARRAVRRARVRRRASRRRRAASALRAAVSRSRSTSSSGSVSSSNASGSGAAGVVEVGRAGSKALAVLLGVLRAGVALGALVPRALVGRVDLRLVRGRHIDAHGLAVDIADSAVCKAGFGRTSSGAGSGAGSAGVAGLALGSGQAQEGDDGKEGVHVVCMDLVRKRM